MQEQLAIYITVKKFSLRISMNYKSIRKGQINWESLWSYNSQKRKPNGQYTFHMLYLISNKGNANKTINKYPWLPKLKSPNMPNTKEVADNRNSHILQVRVSNWSTILHSNTRAEGSFGGKCIQNPCSFRDKYNAFLPT